MLSYTLLYHYQRNHHKLYNQVEILIMHQHILARVVHRHLGMSLYNGILISLG